jgi:16S rRNA pseudouridine516 synthase
MGRFAWRRNDRRLKLQQILFSQGFGTRRECSALIAQGAVVIEDEIQRDTEKNFAVDGLIFCVNGTPWLFCERAYLMLNKPAGFECSHKPKDWPSVYELLPSPLRLRPGKSAVDGVQAIGRLDQDTTGLLIFSDDGQFIHRMASPKHHVPKRYAVTTKHAVDDAAIAALLAGVVLNDDPEPVAAAACERVSDCVIHLTLTEGKYHQVKRMLAAVGNRVEALHRAQIGGLKLDPDLAEGQWRWLTAEDLTAIKGSPL